MHRSLRQSPARKSGTYPRLLSKIRTSEIVVLYRAAKSKTPIDLSDDGRTTLNHSWYDRDELAGRTIGRALRQFRAELRKGRYQPELNPGANGRFCT